MEKKYVSKAGRTLLSLSPRQRGRHHLTIRQECIEEDQGLHIEDPSHSSSSMDMHKPLSRFDFL